MEESPDEKKIGPLNYADDRLAGEAKIVRLTTFTSPVEAQLACSLLESEGIATTIGGENASSVVGGYGPAFSQCDLFVRAADEGRAREVLDEVEKRRAMHELDDEEE